MKCPVCGTKKGGIIDSRPSSDGTMRKRRYKCKGNHRWSTYETYSTASVWKTPADIQKIFDLLAPLMESMGNIKKADLVKLPWRE